MNPSAFPTTPTTSTSPYPTRSSTRSSTHSPTSKITPKFALFLFATPVTRAEVGLLAALLLALLLACVGPHVAQHAYYHAFADQRTLWGVPCALDVLSNLAFALLGAWGLLRLYGQPTSTAHAAGSQRNLATLFFAGLVLTAVCSTAYHLHPNDVGLAIDRLGMVSAFAGLLGLAVADRISARAGLWVATAVLALGPIAVLVWATTGNLLPWSVLQGGGMVLIVVLALRSPVGGAWGIPLAAVIAWYVLAKLLELGDHAVFAATQGWVSGHSLKHVCAAMAAWPVIALMHNGAHARIGQHGAVRA